ncbi:hypothetical protein D9M69_535250 [compost metagenome]
MQSIPKRRTAAHGVANHTEGGGTNLLGNLESEMLVARRCDGSPPEAAYRFLLVAGTTLDQASGVHAYLLENGLVTDPVRIQRTGNCEYPS